MTLNLFIYLILCFMQEIAKAINKVMDDINGVAKNITV
jgi:hypothetical protein